MAPACVTHRIGLALQDVSAVGSRVHDVNLGEHTWKPVVSRWQVRAVRFASTACWRHASSAALHPLTNQPPASALAGGRSAPTLRCSPIVRSPVGSTSRANRSASDVAKSALAGLHQTGKDKCANESRLCNRRRLHQLQPRTPPASPQRPAVLVHRGTHVTARMITFSWRTYSRAMFSSSCER